MSEFSAPSSPLLKRENTAPPRVDILGVQVSAINLEQALQSFCRWIERRERTYVCVTPAHGIMECQQDDGLKAIFNQSGLTTPDGMAVVWLLRLYGYRTVSRVYGPDLMLRVCEASIDQGWSHFFYGGAPGIADKLSRKLSGQFPGLKVAGTYCPPFRALNEVEDKEVVERINQSGADIVWVGISTPKQETWMASHLGRIHAPVMVGVGAAFDFLSGTKPQAPTWMQHSGLEWLFRLASEPRRLWPRYAQYPRFAWLAARQLWQERGPFHSKRLR